MKKTTMQDETAEKQDYENQEAESQNRVDTSDKAINDYTSKIEQEFLEDQNPTKNHKTTSKNPVITPEYDDTAIVIQQCLTTTFAMFDITVDDRLTLNASKSYSALFLKYFPDVAIFDKWKEEIACGISTFALGSAIMIQLRQRRTANQPINNQHITSQETQNSPVHI